MCPRGQIQLRIKINIVYFVENYWITNQLENPFYLWMKRTLIFIFPGEMGVLYRVDDVTVSAGTQGANIHIIGCIGPHGRVYHEIQRGSFRKESAVLDARMVESCKETIWVVDNAPCHSNIEEVFSEEEFLGREVLR